MAERRSSSPTHDQDATTDFNGEEYRGLITSSIRKMSSSLSTEDIEDLVQDTMVRLWERRDEVVVRSESSYACRTARNLVVSEVRKRYALKRDVRLHVAVDDLGTMPDPAPSPEARIISRTEAEELVRTCRKRLSPKIAELVLLKAIYGYTSQELTELLDRPRWSVDYGFARARRVFAST